MPTNNSMCPVCYESYSPANPAKGPGGECVHSMCEACCTRTAEFMRPPFQCPECRRDITDWLVREFPQPPRTVLTLEAAVAFANEFGIIVPSLDILTSQLEEYNRIMTASNARRFAESNARLQAAHDRFTARMTEIAGAIDNFEETGRANMVAIRDMELARLGELERSIWHEISELP